ncbi:MAG: heavy metal transporter [Gammaproteobacteria bacterium]|nr:heavy metal transporter [Gammaproteobacteria bacterium]
MASKTVNVPNISCGHCTAAIERKVSELEGVISVKADKDSKTVVVEWSEPPAVWTQIADLLTEIGYPSV